MDTSDNTHIEQADQQPLDQSPQQQQQQQQQQQAVSADSSTKSAQIGSRLQNAKERQNRQKYEQS